MYSFKTFIFLKTKPLNNNLTWIRPYRISPQGRQNQTEFFCFSAKKNTNFIIKTLLYIILLLPIVACNPTRSLKNNEYLLKKNTVKIESNKLIIDKENITGLIQQKPNKKLFGLVRFKLWFYNIANKGKETKFKKWIKKSLGEKPVIYNQNQAKSSVMQIKTYMNNIGYFNSKVKESKKIHKKQVEVVYDIKPAIPYKIKNIEYNIENNTIKNIVLSNKSGSLIKQGNIYNAYDLEDERDRITKNLQNKGYYFFNNEYIFYEVDSSFNNHSLDIIIGIKNIKLQSKDQKSKFTEENHFPFYINQIYINTNYNPLASDTIKYDTLVEVVHQTSKDNPEIKYYYLYNNKLKIKPRTISQSIIINPGQHFILKDVQQTYKRLYELRMFKYANIQFTRDIADTNKSIHSKHLLDCNINLSRSKVQSYTIETEGTNSGGDLGIGGNLIYQNKNIFRGAEILSVKFKGAMEAQKTSYAKEENTSKKFLFFNTFETGVEINLSIPKFLVPVKQERFPKYFKPKTNITTGLNYQNQQNYRRYITNISFGYNWSESNYKTHILFPADINLVRIFPTPEFDSIINNETNQSLKNQYTNHLVTGLNYSFIYNNQEINKLKNFVYFRGNIETAGNLLNGIDNLIKAPKDDDGYYTLLNIRYAQYVRTDIDLRYYYILNENNRLVFRTVFGIGIPYGNSEDLPFEKGFYAGGSNGMRGWRIKSLGPGAYQNTNITYDKMGDLKLEGNIEYRFPLYKFFKGALFVDVGNIWLLKENSSYPDGKFFFNNFLSELGVDAGIGLRFDFKFFIFRIDGALPFRDPAEPKNKRWVINKAAFYKIFWNFGIGYPF